MSLVETVIAHPAARALGWALVHFVWQGAAIALLLAGALPLVRERSAGLRYALSCLGLAAMAAAPVVTFGLAWTVGSGGRVPSAWFPAVPGIPGLPALPEVGRVVPGAGGPGAALEAATAWQQQLVAGLASSLPWLVVAWAAGVMILTGRLLGGWMLVRRLRRRDVSPLAGRWQATVDGLAARLGVRRAVALLESARVDVPTVIGWLRPVILVPASALTGLPPRQLEAILAHELAHVRRHDYAVNLLQGVVETLLFYHPAVWWVSRQVRVERESCCDDIAVTACGDALVYARALAGLAELDGRPARLAVAASGGSLLRRIRRLVAPGQAAPSTPAAPAVLLCLALVVLGAGGIHATRPPVVQGAVDAVGATLDSADVPLALGGIDPVGLVEGREVRGKPQYAVVHDGLRYLFAGEACMKRFQADPERYAATVSDDGCDAVEGAAPRYYEVRDGRIHLFCCPESLEGFRSERRRRGPSATT